MAFGAEARRETQRDDRDALAHSLAQADSHVREERPGRGDVWRHGHEADAEDE